jgi:putative ABC transport system ATP-binding protein
LVAERTGPSCLVQLDGLARVYSGPPPVEALKPCDLKITAGDFVAVTGPSGSGKTTLLNLLGLLDSPTTGRYRLDGRDVSHLSERQRTSVRGDAIGFVFQAFHLLPLRSAIENVMLSLLYTNVPKRERWRRSQHALVRVGLGHRIDSLSRTMSGGEQQRVAIARAIVKRPRLLLCDEPTGNLDSDNSSAILELLDEVHADGHTIVVITHNPAVAARSARRIELHDGILAESGPPAARHA